MRTERKNYPAIDIAKFICALVILFYHFFSERESVFWLLEEALSLYAVGVALFMTLSGFLLFNKLQYINERDRQWKAVKSQVKRILTVYSIWSIPYLIYYIIYKWDWSNISVEFVLWEIQRCVFQSTFFTIWFMPALAVGMLFAYFIYTRFKWRTVCIFAGIFYVSGAMQSTYKFAGEMIPGFSRFIEFSEKWLQGPRGGVFFGMPLIILGACVAKIKWRDIKWSAICSFAAMVMLLAEAVILRAFVGGCGLDLALFMIPVCLFATIFLASAVWSPKPENLGKYKFMRSMSVLIFMSQRLFLTVIPDIFNIEINTVGNVYFNCIIFCGATILLSVLIIKLSEKWVFIKKLY